MSKDTVDTREDTKESFAVCFRRKSGAGFHVEYYPTRESAEFAKRALDAYDASLGATIETVAEDDDAE
jgi:hypothetical protein